MYRFFIEVDKGDWDLAIEWIDTRHLTVVACCRKEAARSTWDEDGGRFADEYGDGNGNLMPYARISGSELEDGCEGVAPDVCEDCA